MPQDDDLPSQLTVRQTMRTTARLRLAADLSAEEILRRVTEVMERLELLDYADTDVAHLSGGTRKRVSVALELLSDPVVLILDEPTSNLDEGLDRRLMRQLAELADSGTAVIVVTHSMVNLDASQRVLAINRAGAMGYWGPPQDILGSFGANSFGDVMDKLRSGESAGTPSSVAGPTSSRRVELATLSRRPAQTRILANRELRRFISPLSWKPSTWAQPARVVRRLLLAPAIVAMLAYLAGPQGLETRPRLVNDRLSVVLSVVSIAVAFFAASLTSGSIAADFRLIVREGRWGILPRSVVMSRAIVLGVVAAIQGALAAVLVLWVRPGPNVDHPVDGVLLVGVSMLLLSIASAAAGLLISALSRAVEQGLFVMMAMSVAQVALSGLLIPLGNINSLGERAMSALSMLMPTRWAVASLGAGLDINNVPGVPHDGMWRHDIGHVIAAWAALVVLTLAFLLAAVQLLSARLRRRL